MKAFLDGFTDENDNGRRTAILKDYLDLHPPDEEDKSATHLPDLMQIWSFASQSNSEGLLSAVAAVLALLLRTISNILELTDHGLRICRTVLQRNQLELIVRGLTANKGKDYVISPVLRLLREITIFDGGILAKQVFRLRDQTMKGLARNLHLKFTGEGTEDPRKPSVRTNALRFVLPMLKFLPADAKRELLFQRDVVIALTKDIKDDPPFMVREMLQTLTVQVLQDAALQRDAKTKVVNAMSLGRISMLYSYEQPDQESGTLQKPVDVVAHEFLVLACTSHDLGVLNRQTAFYPRGIDPDDLHDVDLDEALLDLGLGGIEWMDDFTDQVPLRNTILSDFIKDLRPWSSTKHRELLLSIFASAPELVADYFYNKKTFSFDPKLTATWIGYSSLLYSAVQLPIPQYFGHSKEYARLPPPHAIVLENILPLPLNQKVLKSCLLHSQGLIRFLAIRILCIAFEKFQKTIAMYHEAAKGSSSLWKKAAKVLSDNFCNRCPSMKDVIHAFRNTPSENILHREAITRLLVSYYEAVPAIALDTKFDVSVTLTQALQNMDSLIPNAEDRGLRTMELENLFMFAHFSPGMRWFTKAQDLSVSPFMAMLKLSAEAPADVPLLRIQSVLSSVNQISQILQTQTSVSALESLVLQLRTVCGTSKAQYVYAFLDDCMSRCATNPVKYICSLEELQTHGDAEAKTQPFSLLTLAIAEQWPFLMKSDNPEKADLAKFVADYLAACLKMNEDENTINLVAESIVTATPEDIPERANLAQFRNQIPKISIPNSQMVISPVTKLISEEKTIPEEEKESIINKMIDDAPVATEDHGALVRWTAKDVEEVVEGGHLASLIMLLSSEHLHIRREASVNISKFAAKLKESIFEEKEQIWLLLCELVESAKKAIDEGPLSTIVTTFASHAVKVLNDPLHCMYPKLNKFLSQGPTWELDKVPLLYKVLDESPSLDDAYYQEVSWLLTYMLAGLRSAQDMAVYRRRRVFEKLFSLWNSSYLAPGLRDRILRILYRATTIEGGSTTLITRFSTMTWLEAQVALGAGTPLKVLLERILESPDKKRVGKWAKGVDRIKPEMVKC
jgi:nucleolar pre-ribosomal-associated protein 1